MKNNILPTYYFYFPSKGATWKRSREEANLFLAMAAGVIFADSH